MQTTRSGPLSPPPGAAALVDEATLTGQGDLLPALRDGLGALDEALAARFRAGEDVEMLVQARAWGVERLLLHAWERCLGATDGLALVAVGAEGLSTATLKKTLGALLKNREDLEQVLPPGLEPGDGPRPGDGYEAAGIVLLGSSASVHDDLPWLHELTAWLRPLLDGSRELPVLGVCFGHQLIAHMGGAEVGNLRRDGSKESGARETRVEGWSLLPGRHDVRVVVSHREEVKTIPAGYRVVARRTGVPLDGLEHERLPVSTFQFHPEARDEFATHAGIFGHEIDERVERDGTEFDRYIFVTSVDDDLDGLEDFRRLSAVVRWTPPNGFQRSVEQSTLVTPFSRPRQPLIRTDVTYSGGSVDITGLSRPGAVAESSQWAGSVAQERESFTAGVLAWGIPRMRDLPWRRSRDPWEILVSEVMLQQTRLEVVLPYWHRWMGRFPSLARLAAASEQEVLHLWQGLGYPRRARNLHATAARVTAEHGGSIPDDLEALLALPGIGPYTARAVLAFAFERDVAVVDTNIARVLDAGETDGRVDVDAGELAAVAQPLVGDRGQMVDRAHRAHGLAHDAGIGHVAAHDVAARGRLRSGAGEQPHVVAAGQRIEESGRQRVLVGAPERRRPGDRRSQTVGGRSAVVEVKFDTRTTPIPSSSMNVKIVAIAITGLVVVAAGAFWFMGGDDPPFRSQFAGRAARLPRQPGCASSRARR